MSRRVLASVGQRWRGWWNRRYQRRLEDRGWYDPDARSDAEAIFIGGCWRSGTSLVREILARHPKLACGPESHLFALPFKPARLSHQWSQDRRELELLAASCTNLVEFGEHFFAKLLEEQHKERWIDKTPQNCRIAERLLTWFPRGRFLHMIRDGRDVVCSLRTYPKRNFVDGRPVDAPPMDRPISVCARTWVRETSAGLETRGHDRLMEVRYEDLVLRPEPVVRNICDFLGEKFDAAMLEANESAFLATATDPKISARFLNNPKAAGTIHRASVGRWRVELNRADREQVWSDAGELLSRLGYAADSAWIDE